MDKGGVIPTDHRKHGRPLTPSTFVAFDGSIDPSRSPSTPAGSPMTRIVDHRDWVVKQKSKYQRKSHLTGDPTRDAALESRRQVRRAQSIRITGTTSAKSSVQPNTQM